MKKSAALVSALVAAVALPALAQGIDVPSVQNNINSKITTNATGAITGAILNSVMQNMVLSYSSIYVSTQSGTAYTVVATDRYKLLTFTNSGAVAVSIPQAISPSFLSGWNTTLINNSTGTVTLTPTISTINGQASLVLKAGQSVTIVSDGANWQAVGNVIQPHTISNDQLIQRNPLSVMGNATSATADVADIIGTTDQVLRINSAGNALAFGQLNLASGSAVSGILPIANGGTNASTAANARNSTHLNIDQVTTSGDTNYTILSTDRTVITSAAFTAPRTWTLPAASSVNAGQTLWLLDANGSVGATNTLTIARAGADTINGATSNVLNSARSGLLLTSDGTSKWSFVVSPGSGTLTNVATTSPVIGGPITTTGTIALNATIAPQGRLTLTSGTPVMTSNALAQTTVYYTPYLGNLVPIYDGTNFTPTAFAEVSQATTDTTKSPAAVVSGSLYDVFCWVDTGPTNRCTRGPAWTNTTTRSAGTALTTVNGIPLNNASITNGPAASRGTYVGTIAANPAAANIDWRFGSASATGNARFGVWNMYNRINVSTFVQDTTASFAFSFSGGYGNTLNNANNNVAYVAGLSEDGVGIGQYTLMQVTGGTGNCFAEVAIDAVGAPIGNLAVHANTLNGTIVSAYEGLSSIGYHTLIGTILTGGGGVTCTQYGGSDTQLNFRFRM